MDRTPCHLTLVTNQHQRQIDAAAARGEAHAMLQLELQVAFLGAMQGLSATVPGFMVKQAGPYVETQRPFVEEVLDALDHVVPLEQFMRILTDSSCPLVAELRRRLADVYVRTTADGVEMARGVA